jgi:ABC-type dipeptide/oligopeptide/nickel transport system permease component
LGTVRPGSLADQFATIFVLVGVDPQFALGLVALYVLGF